MTCRVSLLRASAGGFLGENWVAPVARCISSYGAKEVDNFEANLKPSRVLLRHLSKQHLQFEAKRNTVILNKTIFEASKKQHKQIPFLKVFKTERNSAIPGLSKSHSTSGYFTAVVCDLKLCEPTTVQILGKLKKISKFQYPRLSHSHKPCQSKKCKNKKCIKICERKNLQVNGKKSAVTISTSYTSMLFVHCSPRKKFHLLASLVYAYTLCLGKTCLSTLDAGATRQCLGSTVTEGQATSSWKKTQKRLWALHQTAQRFRHFLMHSPSGGIVLEPDTLVHKADFKRFKRMHPNRIANHFFLCAVSRNKQNPYNEEGRNLPSQFFVPSNNLGCFES